MELYEFVIKVIGPVQPTGESGADQKRLDNMKVLTELTARLLFEISSTTPSADRPEASMKAIGSHAKDFLNEVRSA